MKKIFRPLGDGYFPTDQYLFYRLQHPYILLPAIILTNELT